MLLPVQRLEPPLLLRANAFGRFGELGLSFAGQEQSECPLVLFSLPPLYKAAFEEIVDQRHQVRPLNTERTPETGLIYPGIFSDDRQHREQDWTNCTIAHRAPKVRHENRCGAAQAIADQPFEDLASDRGGFGLPVGRI